MESTTKLLLEAVRGYLSSDKSKLGLDTHEDAEETSHHQWHQWETIDDMFALKASGSPFFESLTSAFHNVHSYKYLNDPTFGLTLESQLRSAGIPADHREFALKYIDEIIKEMNDNNKDWNEKDAGWNPELNDIAEMTRNADTWGGNRSEPHTGGGPAPQDGENKDYSL